MSTQRNQRIASLNKVFDNYARNDYDAIESGYAPRHWLVKDFSLIQHEGRWHLFHIMAQSGLTCLSPDAEHRFGHGSTADFVTWTTHDPVVPALPDTWESHHIYAPYVFKWQGRFHMIYTGINRNMYECLGCAVSDDLFRWQRNPTELPWADADPDPDRVARSATACRDPHVHIEDGRLYLYFSAVEKGTDLPVVGVAVSRDGQHWEDGDIAYRGWDSSLDNCRLLESSCVHRLDSGKYLLTFNTRGWVRYIIGDNPLDFRNLPYLDLPIAENMAGRLCRRQEWLSTVAGHPGMGWRPYHQRQAC